MEETYFVRYDFEDEQLLKYHFIKFNEELKEKIFFANTKYNNKDVLENKYSNIYTHELESIIYAIVSKQKVFERIA